MSAPTPRYSLVVEWSEEDQCYLVTSPEWADQYHGPIAEGKTYEEAIKRGRNALEHMIQLAHEEGQPLPAPRVFAATHS